VILHDIVTLIARVRLSRSNHDDQSGSHTGDTNLDQMKQIGLGMRSNQLNLILNMGEVTAEFHLCVRDGLLCYDLYLYR